MATSISAQQHEELVAATILMWPGNSAAERAKQAAALHLLSCPSFGANSSPIATAVKCKLGATTQQCGLGPFRQLFQQDDCFSVRNVLDSEAWIELRPTRCANACSVCGCYMCLKPSLYTVIVHQQSCTRNDCTLLTILEHGGAHGNKRQCNSTAGLAGSNSTTAKSLCQLALLSSCLDCCTDLRLLQAATSITIYKTPRSSTQQQSPKHTSLRAAALLVWPGDSPAARAKRAAAAHLLSYPALTAASSPVALAVKEELGATTHQCGLGPFRQLLQQDECFSVQDAAQSEAWIRLLPNRCACGHVYRVFGGSL
jgi:hypothetical protein